MCYLTHELSHYFIAKLVGAKNVNINLWPHEYNGISYQGSVSCSNLGEYRSLFYGAPLIKSIILLIFWLMCGLFIWINFIVLILPEIIDICIFIHGYFFGPEHVDGARFRKYLPL